MHPRLEKKYRRFHEIRHQFLTDIAAQTAEQQAFKPNADSWSMLQVTEHLLKSEAGVQHIVDKKSNPFAERPPMNWRARLRWGLFCWTLRSPVRFRVPQRVRGVTPEPTTLDFAAMQAQFTTLEMKWPEILARFTPEAIPKEIFRHPIAGWLTMGHTLDFLAEHITHHQHQIRRIRKANGFPA